MDPHITLLAPDRPTLPTDNASASFKNLELDQPPFLIRAHRLHRFSRHHRHTLVLVPANPTPLTHLFNAVIAGCGWQETSASTRRVYQPHITLVNQVHDHQLALIESRLKNPNLTVGFECTELVLYAKQARWPAWHELEHHLLSNSS